MICSFKDILKDLALEFVLFTAQKMNFSIKDSFSNYDQIRSFLRNWSTLLAKFLMEKLIFCTVFSVEGLLLVYMTYPLRFPLIDLLFVNKLLVFETEI